MFLMLILLVSTSPAAKYLSEGTLLLQQKQNAKALLVLEKAFAQSNDPEELRDIAGLVLEAAPLNYPKREAYLKYLVRFTADEPSTARWLKELGDRAFAANQFEEAEDYYLRVGRVADDSQAPLKIIAEYKLAWVQWSLGRQAEALLQMSQVLNRADPTLRTQMIREFTQFWWDHGPLAEATLRNTLSLPEDDRRQLLLSFVERFPVKLTPSTKQERILIQVRSVPEFQEAFKLILEKNLRFQDQPCFLLDRVWMPSFPVPIESLLACVKSKERPSDERLLALFEKVEDRKDERVDWAEAEILVALERMEDALLKTLNSASFRERSVNFKTFIFRLLQNLPDEKLATIVSLLNSDHLENLLVGFGKDEDYARLQRISPDPWFSLQEKNPKFKNPPLEFYARKSKWALSENPELAAQIGEDLLKRRGSGEFLVSYQKLSKLKETKLPESFSQDFIKAQEKWLADLDRIWIKSNGLTGDLRSVVMPGVLQLLKENLSRIMSQIEAVSLPEEMQGATESFEKKRTQLLKQLENRYEEKTP